MTFGSSHDRHEGAVSSREHNVYFVVVKKRLLLKVFVGSMHFNLPSVLFLCVGFSVSSFKAFCPLAHTHRDTQVPFPILPFKSSQFLHL